MKCHKCGYIKLDECDYNPKGRHHLRNLEEEVKPDFHYIITDGISENDDDIRCPKCGYSWNIRLGRRYNG